MKLLFQHEILLKLWYEGKKVMEREAPGKEILSRCFV